MVGDEETGRERAEAVARALEDLWSATDYPESRDVRHYGDRELRAFLGEWIHVRRACDQIFDRIRKAYPDLPGWDPIGGERPVDERLSEAEDTTE